MANEFHWPKFEHGFFLKKILSLWTILKKEFENYFQFRIFISETVEVYFVVTLSEMKGKKFFSSSSKNVSRSE